MTLTHRDRVLVRDSLQCTDTVHVVIMMVLFRIDSLCFSVSACAGVNITATTRSFSLPMRTGTNVSVIPLSEKLGLVPALLTIGELCFIPLHVSS